MQGRLSTPINDRIQAFPHNSWEDEFQQAKKLGFNTIEWIVDERSNPIFDDEKIDVILKISQNNGIEINSLCADIFMNDYLFKSPENIIEKNLETLEQLIRQCQKCHIKILELPFVDSSSLKNSEHQQQILKNLQSTILCAEECNVILGLETDLEPRTFLNLLKKFNHPNVKANYDIGNSVSNNFITSEELETLKNWIVNIHVKDRLMHGKTVPLGSGDVNFDNFFQKLRDIDYTGDLIIQGARENFSDKINPELTCLKYLEFVNRYLEKRI